MTIATPAAVIEPVLVKTEDGTEYKVPQELIRQMGAQTKDWFAQNCGLSAMKDLLSESYGGMGSVTSVEAALAIRIAAYRNSNGSYHTGYVIASSTNRQEAGSPKMREYMLAAGFKVLDTYVNPAHNSGATITIWGAAALNV